ncbi:MAG: acylphosphatase [Candidatus Nealsonbacteria bacterium]|nr:acylphosphatase [Candidatus Nealsonbacteria bacterium]
MFFFNRKKEKLKGDEKARAHVFVSGRVQGVFYRDTCKKKAEKLGVSGWIKNLRDSRVEGVFEGDRENVDKMVNWARKGPIWAKIDDFSVVWDNYQAEFKGFEIKYDL